MKTVGDRIRFIREQENITLSKMASGLRTYVANLLMIENGTKEPSVRLINKLHSLFPQYSIEWIIYGVENYVKEQINEKTNSNMKNLEKQIEQYLYQLNINAEYEESQILGFDINMENALLGVRIICDNHEKRVMMFAEAPFNIPQEKIKDVLMKVNHIHGNEYNTAHLFVNTETNHLMSQVVLNVDSNNIIDYDVFRYGLCDVCYLIDNSYKEIMQAIMKINPSRRALGMPKQNKLMG